MIFRKQTPPRIAPPPRVWNTPGGTSPAIYSEILQETHILIAGATGSGKSVLINSLVARLLMTESPARARLILIDPKRVELSPLKKLPHCISYANDPETARAALEQAVGLMMMRYSEMEIQGVKKYTGEAVYIIIDEYADLIVTSKKEIVPLVTRLAQLGRAANIHLIVATQRPTAEVIAGAIRVNLDCKIALHTARAQDSRNIIGEKGAELLPRYGFGIMLNAEKMQQIALPPIDEQLPALIDFYTRQ